MIKVCLSHDIDRICKSYQYITRCYRAFRKRDFKAMRLQFKSLATRNPYWGFDDMIAIEEKYKVRSTVFFLNETMKVNVFQPKSYKLAMGRYSITGTKIKNTICYLDKNGWEIGLHGSYNSYNDEELLKHERDLLVEIVGHEIIGVRQHYLNISDKTWSYQKQVGFKYDASFGYNNEVGFKNNRISPFSPFGDEFYVFPLPLMDICFMSLDDRWFRFEQLLDVCEKDNGFLVVNFHQNTFHNIDFPGFKDAYISIIEKCIERGSEFLTLAEAYHQVLRRNDQSLIKV